MQTRFSFPFYLAWLFVGMSLMTGCSPKFDWREVRGSDAPYVVALPGKPATHARTVDLDGVQVMMSMTAAETDGVTFAVGTAELPDAAQAKNALVAMKTALVRNIGGTITNEKSESALISVEASGPPGAGSGGQPRLLLARFIAQDKRVYQLVVVGRENAVARDAADTFFTSFRTD